MSRDASVTAVLSHEAHLLRLLWSPALEADDLGRCACVCRDWRAAVYKDDELFGAALRRDSSALAAARPQRVSHRALAAAARAALKVPRSRAPAWAAAAAAAPQDWTFVADLCDGPRGKSVCSTSFPLSALRDQRRAAPRRFENDCFCAAARRAEDAAVSGGEPTTLAAIVDEFRLAGQAFTMAHPPGTKHVLRLLALHAGGGVAVLCSAKKMAGKTEYHETGGKTESFEATFGTGPRLTAHLSFTPKPQEPERPDADSPFFFLPPVYTGPPVACVLSFSSSYTERRPRYDGPDTDTEWEEFDELEDVTHERVLRALVAGPLRWSSA